MTVFVCRECGNESPKWAGKCPFCGAWNSLRQSEGISGKASKNRVLREIQKDGGKMIIPEKLLSAQSEVQIRLRSGIGEFDGVLGGGIVPGMVILIGGEPGVGKSTLMLQIAARLAEAERRVLYVSGEESQQQIRIRNKRLNCSNNEVYLLCTNSIHDIVRGWEELQPGLVIIDSIQSVYSELIDSSPGSVTQLREGTAVITALAKQKNVPVFLIGHVTKDGSVAGPKIIEHMVDTVLYFEGESAGQYKILRTTKNRFGSTNEIGIFDMQVTGLQQVENPSSVFIDRNENTSGSALGCVMEGSRPFLVEVQALTSAASYGTPQRVTLGFDHRKLAILLAVMERKLGLNMRFNDVFLKLAGGIKISEPSLDLAAVAAILSSYKEIAVPSETILLGEIGLSGEIRPVARIEQRLQEARKLGYLNIFCNFRKQPAIKNIKLNKVNDLADLYRLLFSNK